MRKGDIVLIKATKKELESLGIYDLSVDAILENNKGIIHRIATANAIVRTALGLWVMPIKYLEETGERESD